MALNELWFILVATLFCGYFFFEGFDFGTGMLIPFLSRNDTEKRLLINTIGPVWDANEVWLLTAGGAIFAAFPMWYATMFSGFYLALFLLIAALIARGVAFELRSKGKSSRWKKGWDICISVGSLLAPLLVAVALANLVAGVPIGADGEYAGGFFNLLTVPTIIAGLTAVAVFLYHGSV
ncbi:MAG: cytochrome d ubiquinol oxidase subunit II, partial [Clostridiales bacterium]|nr:cytochrome d ubiquinol oxidase subunit II [Clostridiales bacterium]